MPCGFAQILKPNIMKTTSKLDSTSRRQRYAPTQNSTAEAELQQLCQKLERQMPLLGEMLSEIKTIADWNDHEAEIARGIARCIQDDLDQLLRKRQSFSPSGTSLSEKVKEALQTDQPYWVMVRDEADESYSYQIVIAASREAATEAALKVADVVNGETAMLRAMHVATRDELRWLIQQMDQAEAADCAPPRRRKALGVDEELPVASPSAPRKVNSNAFIERLAKLPRGA